MTVNIVKKDISIVVHAFWHEDVIKQGDIVSHEPKSEIQTLSSIHDRINFDLIGYIKACKNNGDTILYNI